MTTFYLQRIELPLSERGRRFIDSRVHAWCRIEESTQASCWLEAKQKLGFPLTSLQERLLDHRQLRAAA